MDKEYHYICDAEISHKEPDLAYMFFMAEGRVEYSKALEQFPHGTIVEVYIKVK